MQGIKKDIDLENKIRKVAAGSGGSQDLDSVLGIGDTGINKDIVLSDGGFNEMTLDINSLNRNNAGNFTWSGNGIQLINNTGGSATDLIQLQTNNAGGTNGSILINSRSPGSGILKLKTATNIQVDLPTPPTVGQVLSASNVSGYLKWSGPAVAGTPTSAATAGRAGDIQYDATYIYVCTTSGIAGAAVWQRTSALTPV